LGPFKGDSLQFQIILQLLQENWGKPPFFSTFFPPGQTPFRFLSGAGVLLTTKNVKFLGSNHQLEVLKWLKRKFGEIAAEEEPEENG
jgi:hypothetical protein